MLQSLQGFRRQKTGQRRVKAGGAGIHVGVGALPAAADILLLGGVAHLQNHVQALGLVSDAVPGGAEIQKLHDAVLGDVDIVRSHVPVDKPFPVHRRQGPQHRNHHVQRLLRGNFPSLIGNISLEGNALDVVHDEIGGAVFVKIAGYSRDVGVANEFGQGPGLFLKPLRAVGKVLGPVGGHDGDGGPLQAGGDFSGHKFLDGHFGVQLAVPGQIGDAESPLPQHPPHHVPLVQHGSGPQSDWVFGFIFRQVKAAVRAGSLCGLLLLKAVVADICMIHIRFS